MRIWRRSPTLGGLSMKPYRRVNKVFMVEFRAANRLGRARLLVGQFCGDVRSLWHYGAPFPTFLKLIGTLLMFLLAVLPLLYPIFLVFISYFTYEGLFLSWWRKDPKLFHPMQLARRMMSIANRTYHPYNVWKVREVMTRGILLAHSLATSVDYLCVLQGLLDET